MSYGWKKKGGDKSNPAELSLCLMSIMPPQLIPQTLTCCFSGRATAARCWFAPVCDPSKSRWGFSHVWLFSALSFFTKVRLRCRRHWRSSTASAQHSAVESTTIHTWRIERSKVDRMCNLRGEGGVLTLSVSVRNERLSCFMTDILSEKAELPAA